MLSCCSRFRARYKRLVDDIFPAVPEEGLVKNNMEKLIFYALSSPEKLDRIGEYLYEKVCRDISRKQYRCARLTMEAMDQLLISCHAQTLNLFVGSFLRMVQQLLECPDYSLQILATRSFVKFTTIDEHTPYYHLRYDFFVSKFSSMCHNNNKDMDLRGEIRLAGIKGLQGVIRKTISNELGESIWDSVHMNKIIPSLLYNMQTWPEAREESPTEENASTFGCEKPEITNPYMLAKRCFEDLISRASFGHVKNIVNPVFWHLDLHEQWTPNDFALKCFEILAYSIQPQYLHIIVESVMAHLDRNSQGSIKVRTAMADVLSNTIQIVARQSVGTTALEVANSVLTHVRSSVISGECYYQEVLISSLAQFTSYLPDYQKVEILSFVMSKISLYTKDKSEDHDATQRASLKCLLMITSRCSSLTISSLSRSFLTSLLKLSEVKDLQARLLAQSILQSLLDKRGNSEKLAQPTIKVDELNLNYESCSRSNIIFISKNGSEIYDSFVKFFEHDNNTLENVAAVYKSLSLLCLECMCPQTLPDFFNFLLGMQELALNNSDLQEVIRNEIHAAIISLLLFSATIHGLDATRQYVCKIVDARKSAGLMQLLPKDHDVERNAPASSDHTDSPTSFPNDVFLELTPLVECMKQDGLDTLCMSPTTYTSRRESAISQMQSWSEDGLSNNDSVDSFERSRRSSSFYIHQKSLPEDLTFEAMKNVLTESSDKVRQRERATEAEIFEKYKRLSFKALYSSLENKDKVSLPQELDTIFYSLEQEENSTPKKTVKKNSLDSPISIDQALYPEIFVY